MNTTAAKQLAQVSERGNVIFVSFVSAAVTRAGKKLPQVHYENKNKSNGSGRKDVRNIQFTYTKIAHIGQQLMS